MKCVSRLRGAIAGFKLLTLWQEVKLAETRAERDLQESLAEIFSIIVTIDELEKAFLKDAIPESDYTEICERSLKQYNSILKDEVVARAFRGLEEFKAEWDVRARTFAPVFYIPLFYIIFGLAERTCHITDNSRRTISSKSPVQRSA